jgi:ABC-type tungstate transport system substrate-binding protein
MMKQALIYSLKVWLTTAIVKPVLITAVHYYLLLSNHYNPLHMPRLFHLLTTKLYMMVIGQVVLLVPLGVVLYYSSGYLYNREVNYRYIKLYLSAVGLLMALLPDTLIMGYSIIGAKAGDFGIGLICGRL